MSYHRPVLRPNDPELEVLCRTLATESELLDLESRWPSLQLQSLAEAGVFRWFLPPAWGGYGWSEADLLRGYLRLSAACLTTTFILTQRSSACQRISNCERPELHRKLLPGLGDGSLFATVGISHLTTSRRHVQQPALVARARSGGYILDGYSPWVTGATHADYVVVGAQLDDGRQLLVVLPIGHSGVKVETPARLVALSASETGRLFCRDVFVEEAWVIAAPTPDVMNSGLGARTGGLQTSALALGLGAAAISFLAAESTSRPTLRAIFEALQTEQESLVSELLRQADAPDPLAAQKLRASANDLVIRATQAALVAAKGAGFVTGHPAGRWCREALFFHVWSCPAPVVDASLCRLAGL